MFFMFGKIQNGQKSLKIIPLKIAQFFIPMKSLSFSEIVMENGEEPFISMKSIQRKFISLNLLAVIRFGKPKKDTRF